ncbi:hypothetical protein ACQ4OC_07380 [Yersinia sp. J1]|uniref:hypothetical protein n=1 Tax=Yersinia sp. J1 TaxID=3424774 RepID=UPI003D35B26E
MKLYSISEALKKLIRIRKIRWTLFLFILGGAVYFWWQQGTLVREEWSPNHQYVMRFYKITQLIPSIGSPGDGSHYSGYIKIENQAGQVFYTEQVSLMDFIEGPHWSDYGVYWFGTDFNDIVALPTSAAK